MNHQEWQALIPFYLAQSLSPSEKLAFEQYMTRCGDKCQREIAEWRTIASAVWEMTDDAARNLPPLSQEVYNRLNYRQTLPATRHSSNPPRPAYAQPLERRLPPPPSRPRWQLPISLVAGLVVTLLFGGLLIRVAFGPEHEQDLTTQIAGVSTADSNDGIALSSGSFATHTVTPTSILPTDTPDGSRLRPLPTNTPFPTAQLPQAVTSPQVIIPLSTTAPTLTPLPPLQEELPRGGMGGALPNFDEAGSGGAADTMASALAGPATPTEEGYRSPQDIQGLPRPVNLAPNTTAFRVNGVAACDIWNVDTRPMTVYRSALRGAPIVGQVGQDERYAVQSRNGSGWFEIVLEGAIRGWIAPDDAIVIGNCDMLPQPTPTQAPQLQASPTAQTPAGEMLRIAQPNVLVYELPGNGNLIVGQVVQGETYLVSATTSSAGVAWAQVTLENGTQGWVRQLDTVRASP